MYNERGEMTNFLLSVIVNLGLLGACVLIVAGVSLMLFKIYLEARKNYREQW